MADLAARARRLAPPMRRGRRLPALWLVSALVRLPDPLAAAARLPRGAGVLARDLAAPVLLRLAALARRRGLVLLVAAAAGLMFFNHRMRGNPAYALAAIWALVAVFVKQRAYGLDGGQVMAWIALAIAAVLAGQTLLLRLRADGECTPSSRLAN